MTRKNFSFVSAFLLGLIFAVPVSYAQWDIEVNGAKIQQGEKIALSNNDLRDGQRIEFKVSSAGEDVESLKISFDGGRSWKRMRRAGNDFIYRYRVKKAETIDISFMAKTAEGEEKKYVPNVVVAYQGADPSGAIFSLLQQIKTQYENQNFSGFFSAVSPSFPDQMEFREAVDRDFRNNRNIRLFFQEERAVVDPSGSRAIYDVLWKKNFQNTSGANFSDSETITMQFKKERGVWKLAAMRNNTIFGSSLLATIDLTPTNIAFDQSSLDATVVVNNNGGKVAESVKINFYFINNPTPNASRTFHGSETVSSIGVNSQVSVAHDFSSLSPITITHDFIAVVDPDNTIAETGEGNNEAVVRFTP